MSYYLKKHWKPILLLLILTTVIQLMSAGFQLIGMRTFDAATTRAVLLATAKALSQPFASILATPVVSQERYSPLSWAW